MHIPQTRRPCSGSVIGSRKENDGWGGLNEGAEHHSEVCCPPRVPAECSILPALLGTMARAEVAMMLLQGGQLSNRSVVCGRWREGGMWFCFHWLKAEQVRWCSVVLLAVEHNTLLFKRQTVRCSSSFYPDAYWHMCNHSNYGWKKWFLLVFKLPSEYV